MAVKVPITTYKDNPAATFWSRLGTFLTYLTPIVIFCMLLVPLSFPNKGKMPVIAWIGWGILSIAVGVGYFLLVMVLCAVMESKALGRKGGIPPGTGAQRRQGQPGPSVLPVTPDELHPFLRKQQGPPPKGWEGDTLL